MHFERRLAVPRWLPSVVPLIALVVALVLGGLVLVIFGQNPLSTYRMIFNISFSTPGGTTALFVTASPLLLTGLCAALVFSIGVYNIGAEGQLYLGATAAAAAGIAFGNDSVFLVIPAMVVAGALGGALWGLVPALLRAFANTSEILTSLMLNYVGGLFISYLIFDSNSYWRDTSGFTGGYPQGKLTGPSAWWPAIHVGSVSIPFGFVGGVLLAFVVFAVLRGTRFGFQLRVMADAPQAARYAGMRTRRLLIGVFLLSSAMAGLAGASQVGDFSHLFDPNALQSAQYGYTGIAVAALAAYNPIAVVPSALLMAMLTNAEFQLQGSSLPQGLAGTLEGIVLLCVVSSAVFVRYRLRRTTGRPFGTAANPAADSSSQPLTFDAGNSTRLAAESQASDRRGVPER